MFLLLFFRHHPRLNNVNNAYRTPGPGPGQVPAPILTNVNSGPRGMGPLRGSTAYLDRGHPDGMTIPCDGDMRWHQDRRPGGQCQVPGTLGPGHNLPGENIGCPKIMSLYIFCLNYDIIDIGLRTAFTFYF